MSQAKRILVVGGVAGGASCAARLRRLDEQAQIIIFERGPYVSFANCGLPYYVGDVIKKEEALLVATPELFRDRFNIEVRTNSEVTAIDRSAKTITVTDLQSGNSYDEPYDALVLSPGAAPIRPPIEGLDLPGVFTVRTIPDSRGIRKRIDDTKASRAVVVGGGYIGMEMAENLMHRGLGVTIIEMQPQIMPLSDPEMVVPIHDALAQRGATIRLGEQVTGIFQGAEGGLDVSLKSGEKLGADIVILAIGVRPETGLARDAGLELGPRGGIRVDDRMRTSDPSIWAVGDAVEVYNLVTGEWGPMPLAGPANRQGRIAADVICGRDSRFRGVQGTAVVGVFDQVLAMTGPSERMLKRSGLWDEMRCEKVYLHPGHHAGYYPGAEAISIKLIFSKEDGKIVSAQAVGKKGVEKRIDIISMAIQKGGTVFDLEEAELCYSPQFGSAKDPVNFAGMIAANVARGDSDLVHADQVQNRPDGVFLLDVREPIELKRIGQIEGAVNIPLGSLRSRLHELPRDKEIWVYCQVGLRGYVAARILAHHGFLARNLSGGFTTYLMWERASEIRK